MMVFTKLILIWLLINALVAVLFLPPTDDRTGARTKQPAQPNI
jgi:hypothetical protein